MGSVIRHHIKYKEIHGVDETVLMTRSDHSKLHIRLRKTGKCNIPSDELNKISCAASRRDVLDCGGLNRGNLPSFEQILIVLNTAEYMPVRQIADAVGFPKDVVDLVLTYMYETDKICRINIGTPTLNRWVYGLKFDSVPKTVNKRLYEYVTNNDKIYTEDIVFETIKKYNDVITATQLATDIGCCRGTVVVLLKNLLQNNKIKRVNVGTELKKIWIYSRV